MAPKQPTALRSPAPSRAEEEDFFDGAAAPDEADGPGEEAPPVAPEEGLNWNKLLLQGALAGAVVAAIGTLALDPTKGLTLGGAALLGVLCFGALYRRPAVVVPPEAPPAPDDAAPAETLAVLDQAVGNGVSDPQGSPAPQPARPLNRAERRQESRQKRKHGAPRRPMPKT